MYLKWEAISYKFNDNKSITQVTMQLFFTMNGIPAKTG